MKDKELREILEIAGVIEKDFPTIDLAGFYKPGFYIKDITRSILHVDEKLNALIELLDIEEVSHAGRGLKKGKKEVEY